MNRAELLERLRDLRPWLESRGVSELALFGSFARDEAGPESDVDLLVTLSRPMGFELSELEDELAEKLGRPVEFCSEATMNRFFRRRILRRRSLSDHDDLAPLDEIPTAARKIARYLVGVTR